MSAAKSGVHCAKVFGNGLSRTGALADQSHGRSQASKLVATLWKHRAMPADG